MNGILCPPPAGREGTREPRSVFVRINPAWLGPATGAGVEKRWRPDGVEGTKR